jgi:FkbM family methyltransferase
VIYAKYIIFTADLLYLFYKLLVLIKKGDKKRLDEYLRKKNKSFLDFIPESFYSEKICSMNGIKAIPRRNTDDFYVMFKGERREKRIVPLLKLNENEVFVDVGANVGFYTLRVAHSHKDKGVKVIPIEAHPETYEALCRNIQCNSEIKNNIVKVVNKAVSDNRGFVTMYDQYEEKNNRQHSRYSSIHERVVTTPTFKVRVHPSTFRVESDTLDNILAEENVDVMKMDIEGAEIHALEGATQTLGRLRQIIVEVHGDNMDKVKGILEESDFKLEILDVGNPKHVMGSKR